MVKNNMKLSNYHENHKIKNIWEDIKQLIALENSLLEKIEVLEEKVHRLIILVSNVQLD